MTIPMLQDHRVLYAAFDRFPTRKGAAMHIRRMAETLFDHAGDGLLHVLGDSELSPYQHDGRTEIVRFMDDIPNFLERTVAYGGHLAQVVTAQPNLALCHFRDPWSGIPILDHVGEGCTTVYEINGLPSIELPCNFGHIGPSTLGKIRQLEIDCWTAADHIISPSCTMRDNLITLGVAADKIVVIPNGADLTERPDPPADMPSRYLFYFGAVQSWQGVDVLLRAFAQLADFEDLELVICCSNRERHTKPFRRLSRRLGIADRVRWYYRLHEAELAPWRAHAVASVAPLTECPRNLEQGCCPLKILESMASGVPVVASNIPAVRELMEDGVHGRLVRPERPGELARALRMMLEYPEQRAEMGAQARKRIEKAFTWAHAMAKLRDFYTDTCDLAVRAPAS